ncbi:hypothetical protein IQ227_22300 [Anabaena aphanizomenioides LEGE 00250]|uniref:Transposase n=1 Tax=Sphaerospermopsis aphanizomenoides LEGE 00250 TaxID=2777972 RepID=A0ABR9VKB7_9CYAN|nr:MULTISPECIES: hypothetical protein [Sphaerospermopsis]MBE9238670.1 hypothetical protein [Sphaerospermopsis aphanizomenoides LEGE 00250]
MTIDNCFIQGFRRERQPYGLKAPLSRGKNQKKSAFSILFLEERGHFQFFPVLFINWDFLWEKCQNQESEYLLIYSFLYRYLTSTVYLMVEVISLYYR